MTAVVVVALVAMVVGALRSTWSPCGLSMLSSMTPVTEQARGHRWGITAAWYLAGAVAGGLTIGAVLAGLAAVVALVDPSNAVTLTVLAVVALLTAMSDLKVGPDLPIHRRQVDEDWFNRYRRWVYASGFGWQIGTGLFTYITTACLYLIVVASALSADPLFALGVGVGFGTLRGLAVFLGAPLRDFGAVSRLHARLDRWAEPSRVLTGTVQAVLAVAVGVIVAPAMIAVLVAVGLVVGVLHLRRHPAPVPLSAR